MGDFLDTQRPSEIKVWDVATGHESNPLVGHGLVVMGVAFGKRGELASASCDGTVRIWDVLKGEQVGTLEGRHVAVDSAVISEGEARVVRNVCYSLDGEYLAAAYWDGTAKLWETATRQLLHNLQGHRNCVHNVAFSPDGKELATASWDGMIKIWDALTGRSVQTLKGHRSWVSGLQFNPPRRYMGRATVGVEVNMRTPLQLRCSYDCRTLPLRARVRRPRRVPIGGFHPEKPMKPRPASTAAPFRDLRWTLPKTLVGS